MKYFLLKTFVLPTLFCLAGWLWNATSVNGAGIELRPIPLAVDSLGCDLPAPANFHITDIGTDFISVAWEPVQNADAYYLKAVSLNNSAIVADTTVTTTYATLQVPPGGPYDLILAAVAGGCPPSSRVATIPDVITLIVDLIVTGRTMPPNVILLPHATCYTDEVPGDNFWFQVKLGYTVLGNFEIKLNPSQSEEFDCHVNLPVSFGKDSRSLSESLQAFIHENNSDKPPCAEGRIVRIKNLSPESHNLFDLDFDGSNNNVLKLCVTPLSNINYTYSLWMEIGEWQSPRDAPSQLQKNAIPVSIQNPFVENLDIQFPEPASSPVCFQLFDLNGAPVLNQQFPAVQQYNLPTAGLPPGFYLLRIDAAGVSRTYKVVKAR